MVTGKQLEAAFKGFAVQNADACKRMRRAWRNRSPVTQSAWRGIAGKVLGTWDHAAALYVAVGELCDNGIFTPAAWSDIFWDSLASRLPGFDPGEKGLSCGQYDALKRAAGFYNLTFAINKV